MGEKEVMEMPQQLKMKSASKAVKLNVNMSQASKARIVDKPWKFSTKNVDECNICSNELFSVCHPHISRLKVKKEKVTPAPFVGMSMQRRPPTSPATTSTLTASSEAKSTTCTPPSCSST